MGAAAGGAVPYYASPSGDVVLYRGDCEAVLPMLPAAGVDAIVTDPPYGLGFMGKEWDSFSPGAIAGRAGRKARKESLVPDGQAGPLNSAAYVEYDHSARGLVGFQRWCEAWARECLRVLKPGGYLVAFGSPRTYHRLACGLEDGGFVVKDSLMFLHGQGFPKSRNLGGGWGTALKPAYEPIALAQKPLAGTYATNVQKWGVGGLNVDGCRITAGDGVPKFAHKGEASVNVYGDGLHGSARTGEVDTETGRWPANVLLDDEAAALLDAQSGALTSNSGTPFNRNSDEFRHTYGAFVGQPAERGYYGDTGGASRFFYCAKASRAERNAGLEGLPLRKSADDGYGTIQRPMLDRAAPRENWEPHRTANHHPTVKPLAVCAWLVRLVTPAGGVVLDPFMGSGSIGCAAVPLGYRYVGIEREVEYLPIATARIRHWAGRARQAGLDLGAAGGG